MLFLGSVDTLRVSAVVQDVYLRTLKSFLSASARSSEQQGMNLKHLCTAFIL